jgi:ABC-type polar amino acid transport system ATPase subunit
MIQEVLDVMVALAKDGMTMIVLYRPNARIQNLSMPRYSLRRRHDNYDTGPKASLKNRRRE